MLITTNPKNIYNKYNNAEPNSFLYQKQFEKDSYKRIQSIINSKDLNKLIQQLEKGCDPNGLNNFGETALFFCLNRDYFDAFEILLKYNADCNIQRKDGNSVLHLAIKYNKINFIKVLLENNANPNLINKNENQTPFHLAIIKKMDEDILLRLKENGANRNIKDKFNKTPFDYAIETKDNNYILLFNKIFEEKEIILINKEALDKSKEKFTLNPNKFKYLPKHSKPRNIIIKDNNENIDTSNFNGDTNANTNSNTMSELYTTRDCNINSKNKIINMQDTIKEIQIDELKDFSLNDTNFISIKNDNQIKDKNNIDDDIIQRKCQSLIDSSSKDIMKKIIFDTIKKLNNSQQILQKSSAKKYLTKNLFKEKTSNIVEDEFNNKSATFENPNQVKAVNNSGAKNIVSGTSSIIEEKESNSNNFIKEGNTDSSNNNYNKVSNNIIILKDDLSDYCSNYDSLTNSLRNNQEKNNSFNLKKEPKIYGNKNLPNMKYMIMKQIKEKNKLYEIGASPHISNKLLSQLRNWLISCDLLSYYNTFVEKKIVDIEKIISTIKQKKLEIDFKLAEDIGIKKPGHIIRFLLKLQIDSEILNKNLCDIILEKYCNNNINTFVLNSASNDCKCCGMSCFSRIPADSCDFNEFTNYINNNDIFAFLRSKDLFEFKDNFIHNGFDQVDFIIIQLFSEFKFNKNFLTEFFHIYHENDQKKVIKILYEEKEKICKELNIPFDKKEVEDILLEFKVNEDYLEEEQCFIF